MPYHRHRVGKHLYLGQGYRERFARPDNDEAGIRGCQFEIINSARGCGLLRGKKN